MSSSSGPESPKEAGGAPAMVSIVLPVHNQAGYIGDTVAKYETALAGLPGTHEIILVTNACRDNSVEVCRELASKFPTVRTANTERGGWGLAVKLGLSHAKGDMLCYTNSARTTPDELRLLIDSAFANPGMAVKGHRISRESFTRKIGSLLYNTECRVLFNLPAWDINATPKVFSREIYDLLQLRSDGDLIDLEFYVKCMKMGRLVLEVPVYSVVRHGGKSTTNFKSAWRMYLGAFHLWRDHKDGLGVFSPRDP